MFNTYIPFWLRPSWLAFVVAPFKAGQYWNALVNLINKMPIFFYPLSEQDYFNSVIKYGEETWWAPHNMFRQVFHLLGGLFIGIATGLIPYKYSNYIILGIILISFGYLEFIIDLPQGKEWQKACLDLAMWTLGTYAGLSLYKL